LIAGVITLPGINLLLKGIDVFYIRMLFLYMPNGCVYGDEIIAYDGSPDFGVAYNYIRKRQVFMELLCKIGRL